jgi:hypothetical protein
MFRLLEVAIIRLDIKESKKQNLQLKFVVLDTKVYTIKYYVYNIERYFS